MRNPIICALTLISLFYTPCFASWGDSSHEFRRCLHLCNLNNCTGHSLIQFKQNQSIPDKFLLWSCEDSCKYNCMWQTIEIFNEHGWEVPQFYGKWPFIKFLGIQEPASVVFSFLNFHAHLHNLLLFWRKVPSTAPTYLLWNVYSFVCLNAWLWSMVFHARDTNFTEKMDYFCAFSMVTFSFLAFCLRILLESSNKIKTAVTVAIAAFFLNHIWYLSKRSFDYSYNMKVNVMVGLVNGIGWLIWSWSRGSNQSHLVWCRITVAGVAVSMLLELLDFAPFAWTFDAHALWHLSTCPLPFYWYRFIIGDCLRLLEKKGQDTQLKKSL